jgi:hypothetical protein
MFIAFALRCAHDLTHHSAVGGTSDLSDALRVYIHRHLEVGVAERFLDRLHILSIRLHRLSSGRRLTAQLDQE